MKKYLLLIASLLLVNVSFAQSGSNSADGKFIIYKWYDNGVAHYAKAPPRGVKNYDRLNEYGMLITDRPDVNSLSMIKINRKKAEEALKQKKEPDVKKELAEGTITREERCNSAKENVRLINERETIYEEDESGNLVPLDSARKSQRLKTAKDEVKRFCN